MIPGIEGGLFERAPLSVPPISDERVAASQHEATVIAATASELDLLMAVARKGYPEQFLFGYSLEPTRYDVHPIDEVAARLEHASMEATLSLIRAGVVERVIMSQGLAQMPFNQMLGHAMEDTDAPPEVSHIPATDDLRVIQDAFGIEGALLDGEETRRLAGQSVFRTERMFNTVFAVELARAVEDWRVWQ